ncbi:hypothetical protein QJR30_07065 [Paraclostridium sordellii]|uniref:hypothetical protein n=1 Tax=Paraclostridium sordellii TaxID=1505 RepID=UPI0005E0E757|nr:hypothetical protein [Paeniclostridium sordellii]CEP80263.1 Uncharacterised protein [[Clostridium] sordellii] [Paeniclostridium sordellii]
MKNKIKYIILIVIILGVLTYLFLTPIGALRLAVLRNGYPINALNLSVDYSLCRQPIDVVGKQTFYTIIDCPIEEKTQTPLDSWIISKYGILYWGEYYMV